MRYRTLFSSVLSESSLQTKGNYANYFFVVYTTDVILIPYAILQPSKVHQKPITFKLPTRKVKCFETKG